MATNVKAWEDDPANGNHPDGGSLVLRPVPTTNQAPFATRITTAAPPPAVYKRATAKFRYWACSDSLRRSSDTWGAILGGAVAWNPAIGGPALPINLDAGEDLNAYYDRSSLTFFHGVAGGRTVYSGESPDVVCHEFGHAVLDAIRPELWDVAGFEAGAFHESFGDISAILSALSLPTLRARVLAETNGNLFRSSSLSRLAEQLGWAIRTGYPDLVDPDCLRNASNSFRYLPSSQLPSSGAASVLSQEPHSLSRVFTAGFLGSLAGVFASGADQGEAGLLAAAESMGRILVGAVRSTPIVDRYFPALAAHMVAVGQHVSDAHAVAIRTAMARNGILSVGQAVGIAHQPHLAAFAAPMLAGPAAVGPSVREIDTSSLGLTIPTIRVIAPATSGVGAAGGGHGMFAMLAGHHPTRDTKEAEAFVTELARRGRLDPGSYGNRAAMLATRASQRVTHALREEDGGIVLRRVRVDGCLGHSV